MKKNILLICFIFIGIFNLKILANDTFMNQNNIEIIASYDNKFPEDVPKNIKFEKHPEVLDYIFITTRTANLRSTPETDRDNIIKKYTYDVKLKLIKKIKYKANFWYYVEDEKGTRGYIAASVTAKRNFRFQMALEKIKNLEDFINNSIDEGYKLASTNTYTPNPNHQNLSWQKDKYGTSIDQNLIGYHKNEKIIIPDRSVVKILETRGNNVLVKVLSIPETLEIPKNKLTYYPNITGNFKKIIAIDIENQNLIIFEKSEKNIWEVISYVYSKTGIDSQLGFETPKGYFSVPTVKYVMEYNDENGQKQGAARFATRFSGGGYLHGTPINEQEEINREFFMKQKEFTLGTFTGTRKCVRTTEDHARFLFDWIVEKPNRNSNIQRPSENVYFIVF